MKFIFLSSLIFFLFYLSLHAAQTSASFLKAGFGIREISVGEAGIGSRGQAGFLSQNTAGIATAEASFLHMEKMGNDNETHHTFLQASYSIGGYDFGFSILNRATEGLPPADEDGHLDPESPFGWQDLMLALEAGRRLGNTSIGIAAKGFRQSALDYSRMAAAVDAGLHQVVIPGRISAGISVQHAGKTRAFFSETEDLPLTCGAGITAMGILGRLSLESMLDVRYRLREKTYYFPVGAELNFAKWVFLRAGFPFQHDPAQPRLGIGLRIKKFQVDYAVMLSRDDFPMEHGLGITFWGY